MAICNLQCVLLHLQPGCLTVTSLSLLRPHLGVSWPSATLMIAPLLWRSSAKVSPLSPIIAPTLASGTSSRAYA